MYNPEKKVITSYLIDSKNPSSYVSACAFDTNLKTKRFEGKQGDIVGVYDSPRLNYRLCAFLLSVLS